MNKAFALLMAALGAASSSCSSDEVSSTPCAQRSGTFVLTWVEQSGDCGPLADETETFASQPTTGEEVKAGCTGTVAYSGDNCGMTTDLVCPGSSGFTVKQKRSTTWSQDGTSGTATIKLELFKDSDASLQCSSVYLVTIKRN
jgi:hypothetical protein